MFAAMTYTVVNHRLSTPLVPMAFRFCMQVGLMCVHTVVSFRPTMRECVGMLLQQMEVPPLPQRPITLFTVPSNHTEKSSSFMTNTTRSISSTLGSKAQE